MNKRQAARSVPAWRQPWRVAAAPGLAPSSKPNRLAHDEVNSVEARRDAVNQFSRSKSGHRPCVLRPRSFQTRPILFEEMHIMMLKTLAAATAAALLALSSVTMAQSSGSSSGSTGASGTSGSSVGGAPPAARAVPHERSERLHRLGGERCVHRCAEQVRRIDRRRAREVPAGQRAAAQPAQARAAAACPARPPPARLRPAPARLHPALASARAADPAPVPVRAAARALARSSRGLLRKKLRFGRGFRVIPGNRFSQAAEMVLEPGDAEGDSTNRHRGADQWLFVLSGNGRGEGGRQALQDRRRQPSSHRGKRAPRDPQHRARRLAHAELLRPAGVPQGRRAAPARKEVRRYERVWPRAALSVPLAAIPSRRSVLMP